jgi:hypothetical protein
MPRMSYFPTTSWNDLLTDVTTCVCRRKGRSVAGKV